MQARTKTSKTTTQRKEDGHSSKITRYKNLKVITDIQQQHQQSTKRKFKSEIVNVKLERQEEKKKLKMEVRDNVWDKNKNIVQDQIILNPRAMIKQQFKSSINSNSSQSNS